MEKLKFYERETPETVCTWRNRIEYFPNAKNLCISRPDFVADDGNVVRGKTVTLDLFCLTDEAKALLKKALFSS